MEDVVEVQRRWRVYFGTPPPIRVTTKRIRDKFEVLERCKITHSIRIGRRGTATEFPPRSPDLTPLDIYLWGTSKNTVCATKPQTQEELRDQIEHAINDIPLTTIQTVCRCWECTVAEGGHFEHVRD